MCLKGSTIDSLCRRTGRTGSLAYSKSAIAGATTFRTGLPKPHVVGLLRMAARLCGFNWWMQQIGEIVQLVFCPLAFFLAAHSIVLPLH